MQRLFYIEAVKYNVLPLDNPRWNGSMPNRPSNIRGLNAFTYYDGMVRIPEGGAPDLKNKSFGISAVVDIPQSGAEACSCPGWTLCGAQALRARGRPVFHYNLCGVERYTVAGADKLTPGRHVITVDFNYDGGGVGKGGEATLTVDGKKVASEKLRRTIGYRMSLDETLDIGEDTGTPVSEDYHAIQVYRQAGKGYHHTQEEKLTEAQLQEYRENRVKGALAQ